MNINPLKFDHYYVFIASPSDMSQERQLVHKFFKYYNNAIAKNWGVRFEVIDWENASSIGIGRAQGLINSQTLEKYRESLALVIGLLGQKYGQPTGEAESGTEEEFNWAFDNNKKHGFPEIKWFFKKIDKFVSPPDPDRIQEALDQWKKVRDFKERLKTSETEMYFKEYGDIEEFKEVVKNDFSLWLADDSRAWSQNVRRANTGTTPVVLPPIKYFQNVCHDFQWLDIAGIDCDRAFQIPLSKLYVRLRVLSQDCVNRYEANASDERKPIDIKEALGAYKRLVVVGDPGSGKSTFLKFISLIIARAILEKNTELVFEKLGLGGSLPLPVFISCWDLSDFLLNIEDAHLSPNVLLEFIFKNLAASEYQTSQGNLEALLNKGKLCLLIDGLDEVATEHARVRVSKLIQEFVNRYGKNRYVVTSRIRAYSGDTVLKGSFVRCDIQPFNASDRRRFLRNWFSLLFGVPAKLVLKQNGECRHAYADLLRAIENQDRIKALAVNPLLLTVIAIVHWNRKRLPEERVDIYDESIDVLLGQRREAERSFHSRFKDSASTLKAESRVKNRSWIRKRFSEIALRMMAADNEEITQDDILALLVRRFIDMGAPTREDAMIQAERFLDHQELASGLLVSRRSKRYRFVHLTFQEYLTAWWIANQDYELAVEIITPKLRKEAWFESLELLGCEWAKKSDECLDRYINLLLNNKGKSIGDQAPVMALCSNILNDTEGVAVIKPETRSEYEKAIKRTLGAFGRKSEVAEKVQLEILQALGKLGIAVKRHLVKALGSPIAAVRIMAAELLLSHLEDDELFSMSRLLRDDHPRLVTNYFEEILERNTKRSIVLLHTMGKPSEQVLVLMDRHSDTLAAGINSVAERRVLEYFINVIKNSPSRGANFFSSLGTKLSQELMVTDDFQTILHKAANPNNRAKAIELMLLRYPKAKTTYDSVVDALLRDKDWIVRCKAVDLLSHYIRKNSKKNWEILKKVAQTDASQHVRKSAVSQIVDSSINVETKLDVITGVISNDKDGNIREFSLRLIGGRDEYQSHFHRVARNSAARDPSEIVRSAALELLYNCSEIQTMLDVVYSSANDPSNEVKTFAMEILANEKDVATRAYSILANAANKEPEAKVRIAACQLLASHWRDDDPTWLVLSDIITNSQEDIEFRAEVFGVAYSSWGDTRDMKNLLEKLATEEGASFFIQQIQSELPYTSPGDSYLIYDDLDAFGESNTTTLLLDWMEDESYLTEDEGINDDEIEEYL